MTKKARGFTLIELLVVIAIIGILSSVVLASLNSARNKGSDAKIKAQLSGARAAAEVYYDNNANTYGAAVDGSAAAGSTIGTGCAAGMFAATELASYTASSNYPSAVAGLGKCTSSGSAYAISSRLMTTGQFWCVDSTGVSRQTTVLQANSVYVCP